MALNQNNVGDTITPSTGTLNVIGTLQQNGVTVATGGINLPAKNIIASSAAITTTETYVTPAFLIPANTLVAGDKFVIKLTGVVTNSASGNNVSFNTRFGAAGTTADAIIDSMATTTPTGGTNTPWEATLEVVVRSIGATGTLFPTGNVINSSTNNGISNLTNVIRNGNATTTVDTTVNRYLGVSIVSVATTSVTVTTATVSKVY